MRRLNKHVIILARMLLVIHLGVTGMFAFEGEGLLWENPFELSELVEGEEKDTDSKENKKLKEIDEFVEQYMLSEKRIKQGIGEIENKLFAKVLGHFEEIPTPPPQNFI